MHYVNLSGVPFFINDGINEYVVKPERDPDGKEIVASIGDEGKIHELPSIMLAEITYIVPTYVYEFIGRKRYDVIPTTYKSVEACESIGLVEISKRLECLEESLSVIMKELKELKMPLVKPTNPPKSKWG